MHAVVLTGRVLPGRTESEVWASLASQFKLGDVGLRERVLSRAPVTVREVADATEAQRMLILLRQCGAEAELVTSDGTKWQLDEGNGVRGPVPLSFLQVAYASQRLSGSARVKRATDTTWLPLSGAVAGDTATRIGLTLPPELGRTPQAPPPLPSTPSAVPSLTASPPPLPPAHGPIPAAQPQGRKSNGWIWALVTLPVVAIGGWLTISTFIESSRVACSDEEVVNLVIKLLDDGLAKNFAMIPGISNAQGKKLIDLQLDAVGTLKRDGGHLQCSALLRAKANFDDNHPMAIYRAGVVSELDNNKINYDVLMADDGEHFTVSVSAE